MNATARSASEYSAAYKDLCQWRPLVGSHRIGQLTILVGERTWRVTDGKHYTETGRARTGGAMLIGIGRAIQHYTQAYAR